MFAAIVHQFKRGLRLLISITKIFGGCFHAPEILRQVPRKRVVGELTPDIPKPDGVQKLVSILVSASNNAGGLLLEYETDKGTLDR